MRIKLRFLILSLVCLAFALTVLSKGRSEEGMAVSKDGIPISYALYGKGGQTLIFVHGWSCNQSYWNKQIPYFKRKYRMIVMDLAGHGKSGTTRDNYTLRSFGEDIAAVIRKTDSHNVILIGHSLGGAIIIEAAEIIPERIIALVGIDTMQDFEEKYNQAQIDEFLKPFKENFVKATDSFVRGMFVKGTDPKFVNEIAGKMSKASAKVGVSALENMFKRSYITDPPKIKVPVWCLNADLWPTKPEINRKYVPQFNLRVMKGVGHFLMLESPDMFNRSLEKIFIEIGRTTNR